MASGTKLKLSFSGDSGNTVNFNYNYAKSDLNAATAKALMQGMITNGDIFSNPPTAIKEAKLVTTNEKVLNVTE